LALLTLFFCLCRCWQKLPVRYIRVSRNHWHSQTRLLSKNKQPIQINIVQKTWTQSFLNRENVFIANSFDKFALIVLNQKIKLKRLKLLRSMCRCF